LTANGGAHTVPEHHSQHLNEGVQKDMPNPSNEQIQKIRERLNSFLKINPAITDREVGKEIGYSGGYVNQFRNNKFPVPATEPEIAAKVENYLENISAVELRKTSEGHLKFVNTTAAQQIFKIIDYSLTDKKIGLITGEAGIGKSISLAEYHRKNPTSILIEVTPVVSPRSLISEMCNKLKIIGHNSVAVMFDSIVNQLRDTNRLLIIDEGENLNTACLEIIRRVHDFTNIGIILAGTSRLQKKLRGDRGQLQQLYSRIGIQKEVKNFILADVRAILSVNYPDGEKFAATFLQLSKQNGRLLEHLISLVKRTTKNTGELISDDLIDDAASMLLM
jgi:DNA transposition AAA+ family ATPase